MDTDAVDLVIDLARAAESARGTPEQDAADSRLAAAGDDVRDALVGLLDVGDPRAVALAGMLSGYWQDVGGTAEGRMLTARAAALGANQPPTTGTVAALARVHLVEADLAFRQGDQDAARDAARAAIANGTEAGEHRTVALAWLDLARVAFRDGDAAGIEASSLEAQRVAPDDPLVQRGVLHMLAWASHTADDLDMARRRFEASLALRREQGGSLGVAAELGNLGDLALEAGDLPSAVRWLAEALDVALELDSQYLIVNTLPSLAAVSAAAGDDRAAASLFGAAAAAARASGLVPDPGGAREDVRDAVRARLGDGPFDAAFAAGEREPVAEALRRARLSLSRSDTPYPAPT